MRRMWKISWKKKSQDHSQLLPGFQYGANKRSVPYLAWWFPTPSDARFISKMSLSHSKNDEERYLPVGTHHLSLSTMFFFVRLTHTQKSTNGRRWWDGEEMSLFFSYTFSLESKHKVSKLPKNSNTLVHTMMIHRYLSYAVIPLIALFVCLFGDPFVHVHAYHPRRRSSTSSSSSSSPTATLFRRNGSSPISTAANAITDEDDAAVVLLMKKQLREQIVLERIQKEARERKLSRVVKRYEQQQQRAAASIGRQNQAQR